MVQQFIVLIHVLAQSHSCVLSSTIWWPTKSLYIRTSLWLDTLCHTFMVILILEAGGLSAICRLTARDASADDTAEGRKWNSGAEAIKTSLPWQMSRSSHQPRRLLLLLQRFLLLSLSTPRAGHSGGGHGLLLSPGREWQFLLFVLMPHNHRATWICMWRAIGWMAKEN